MTATLALESTVSTSYDVESGLDDPSAFLLSPPGLPLRMRKDRGVGGEDFVDLERETEFDDEEGKFFGSDSPAEYVTAASYGNSYDFYGSSSGVCPGGQPVFTRRVLLFFLTTFFVRPTCCAMFFSYGRFTGDYRLFDICLAVTLLFYGTIAMETAIMYLNVRADRMPFGRTQRVAAAFLEIVGPVVFVCSASAVMFKDPRFFQRPMKYPRPPEYGDKIDLLTGISVLTYLSYSVLTVSDCMGFVAPRLWVLAMTKTGVPF